VQFQRGKRGGGSTKARSGPKVTKNLSKPLKTGLLGNGGGEWIEAKCKFLVQGHTGHHHQYAGDSQKTRVYLESEGGDIHWNARTKGPCFWNRWPKGSSRGGGGLWFPQRGEKERARGELAHIETRSRRKESDPEGGTKPRHKSGKGRKAMGPEMQRRHEPEGGTKATALKFRWRTSPSARGRTAYREGRLPGGAQMAGAQGRLSQGGRAGT